MSKTQVRVSVILPFLNGGAAFPIAVRSILQQTYTNLELLLCDDGSTDGSLEWARTIRDPRVRIWSDGKSLGLASRLNECIDRAGGSLIARMDADDISYPNRLQRQVRFLWEHPEIDLVGCPMLIFGETGQPLGKRSVPLTHAEITATPALGFPIAHPTWLARRHWYQKHRYNPEAVRFEDAELLLRSHVTSRFSNLTDLLYGYRELKGGFWKRYQTRIGRVRYLKSRRGSFGSAFYQKAVLAEALKLPFDAAITSLSLRYVMLRAREERLSAAEIAEWQQVNRLLLEAIPSTPAARALQAGA